MSRSAEKVAGDVADALEAASGTAVNKTLWRGSRLREFWGYD